MSELDYLLDDLEKQAKRLPLESSTQVYPPSYTSPTATVLDPLRRDFISECLNHFQRLAALADHAICLGQDDLYERQIQMMRLVMKEASQTYREMKDCE